MVGYFRTPSRSRHRDLPPDATVVDGSRRVVWLSGVQAWDGDDVILGRGDAGEQVRVTMGNIEAILVELGGSLADLVKGSDLCRCRR